MNINGLVVVVVVEEAATHDQIRRVKVVIGVLFCYMLVGRARKDTDGQRLLMLTSVDTG